MRARRQPSYLLIGEHCLTTHRKETADSVQVTIKCRLELKDPALTTSTAHWLERRQLHLPGIKQAVRLLHVHYHEQEQKWEFKLVATFKRRRGLAARMFQGRRAADASRQHQPQDVFMGFATGLEEFWRLKGYKRFVRPWPTPKLTLRRP